MGMMQKVKEAWKAVVALLVPIAFGAAVEMVDALGEWATSQSAVWSGVAVGVLTSVGVWLKANAPKA